MSRPRLIALLLALATLVVYLPATHHDFLCYDDDDYVTGNLIVENGLTLAGLKWAFTTFHAANWHPLTWLSHMADCQFFKLNAGAHHFVNVLFHSANSALLFILLWRLTQKLWPAAVVAALFAWHPLHVESVAWVSERKDVLSTFFALLSLLSYARYVQENSRRSYWLSLIFFALGLLAKPMLVTLPFLLLLLDFWPLNRFTAASFGRKLLPEKWAFFLLTAASCVVTCFAQRRAMDSLEVVPPLYRLENAVVSVAHYLLALFWPVNLAIVYPFERIPGALCALVVAALLLVSIGVWLARKRSPCWLAGWLWFIGTLVPVIGLVQVGSAARADRYTYIPSIGIFIAVVFGLHELALRWSWLKKMFPVIAAGLLAACIALTEYQLSFWQDSGTLFRHALAVTKDNDVAHDNLGVFYEKQNRAADALAEYTEALRLNPTHYQLHFAMGNMLEKMGRLDDAMGEYRFCVQRDPKIPAIHDAIGRTLARQGKFNEALTELAEAGRLDSHYATPHLETARIFFQQGSNTEAVAELRLATQAEPHSYAILAGAARYLASNPNSAGRDGQAALVLALKANDLSGGSEPEVLDTLGMAFAETGDFTNALACAQSALDLSDTNNLKTTALLRQQIVDYQNQQPWRESIGGTNQP